MLDIGVSAAAYEKQQTDEQQTMQEASLASAYASFAASEAWTDIKLALDQMVDEAEASLIELEPGAPFAKKRDTFVEYQTWKKIRVSIESRVTQMSQKFAVPNPQES